MNKKQIGLMKDEFGGKVIPEFVALRSKTYFDLNDDDQNVRKVKETKKKKCAIKVMFKFNDNRKYLLKNKIILKSQQRFKSEGHCV